MLRNRLRSRVANRLALFLTATMLSAGCGGGSAPSGPTTPPPSYDERIAAGWASFTAGDFLGARTSFTNAITDNASRMEAFVGLGWSELRLGDEDQAHAAFATGAALAGADELRADLAAGWAFAWNARKTVPNGYAESNTQIVAAESLAPAWSLPADPSLDRSDLRWLAATNHYARGEFAASLIRVRELDPTFTADVATAEGQAALALRIEALRG